MSVVLFAALVHWSSITRFHPVLLKKLGRYVSPENALRRSSSFALKCVIHAPARNYGGGVAFRTRRDAAQARLGSKPSRRKRSNSVRSFMDPRV